MITVQVESFRDCIPELRVIFDKHHKELGLFRNVMPLDPNYHEYCRRENEGILFLTTVRRDGTIVAYYTAQTVSGFHYASTFTGTMDIAYVVPEERNRGLALPLFRRTEAELKRRGVKVWYSGYKVNNPLGMPELLNALGFMPADFYCAKWIG
jgi:GNAT superfamily N-acetyltransferase